MAATQKAKPEARKSGRPTLLTDASKARLLELARLGLSVSRIARSLGFHPDTVNGWLRENEELAAAVEQQRTEGLVDRLEELADAGINCEKPDWRAVAWMIEKLYPEEFGRNAVLETNADTSTPVEKLIALNEAHLQELRSLRRTLKK